MDAVHGRNPQEGAEYGARASRDHIPGRAELCEGWAHAEGLSECCFETLLDRRRDCNEQCRLDREAADGQA